VTPAFLRHREKEEKRLWRRRFSDRIDLVNDSTTIDYSALMNDAARAVVARVLQRVAEEGLPGEHFFYLTLRTDHPGADIPPAVRKQYPEELTIVLQEQFWNLYADDELFAVDLRFGGISHRIVVPYEALTVFVDPPGEFQIQLGPTRAQEEAPEADQSTERETSETENLGPGQPEERRFEKAKRTTDSVEDGEDGESSAGATVVQFDSFRKR